MNSGDYLIYDFNKALVMEASISTEILDFFKKRFKSEISPRRLRCIQNMIELINCLERKDILREDNIGVLKDLVIALNNKMLTNSIAIYEVPIDDNHGVNKYAKQRLTEEIKRRPTQPVKNVKIFNEQQRQAVYKIIASGIGINWRSFGRELGICEGEMDQIELQHPRDLSSRVYKIFMLFEEDKRFSLKDHAFIICKALADCRRKDMRRDVETILTR